jgi:hypothetical protein
VPATLSGTLKKFSGDKLINAPKFLAAFRKF